MRLLSHILVLMLSITTASAFAADPATVNGKPVKQSVVDYIQKEASARGQKIDDNAKALILNRLIANEVVFQEAQKAGLDKQSDYVIRSEIQSRELLIQTYFQDYLKKNPVDDATLKSEYEKFKAQWGDKEYRTSHIVLKTEQEAKDVIEQLGKKADFAKLAREKSIDASKEKGGDLGWLPPGRMGRVLSDAVTKLSKGAYTSVPVQTQFGWHVIRLDDVRDAPPPTFDTVKDELRSVLQKQQIDKLVNDLRAKAKIVESGSSAAAGKAKK